MFIITYKHTFTTFTNYITYEHSCEVYCVFIFILFLILSTALIKNSTKRIEDEIFIVKENIRDLKKDFENTKLENDYLSSAESSYYDNKSDKMIRESHELGYLQ